MRCEVEQAEFTYQAALRWPLLDVLATSNVYARILAGLAPFRVGLDEIKVQTAGPNPSDQLLVCLVPGLEAAVRYRLDRVEVASSSRTIDEKMLGELIEAAVTIAKNANQTFAIGSNGMTLAVHGRVTGGTVDDLIATHVPKAIAGSPPLRPEGVTFRVEAAPPIDTGNVTIEHSQAIERGVLLRVVTLQNGDIRPRQALTIGMDFIRDTARRLDCELIWATR